MNLNELKLMDESNSVISGYKELSSSFASNDIANVRIKGRNNQYEFRNGIINATLDEQQQRVLKRKAIKQAHERLKNLDILQKERATKAQKEIEVIQKEREEFNLLRHKKRVENSIKRKKIAEFKERYSESKHKRSNTKKL